MAKKKKPKLQPEPYMEKIQKRIDLEEELGKSCPRWFWPGLVCVFFGFALLMTILIARELAVQKRRAKRFPQITPTPSSVISTDTLTHQLEKQGSSDEVVAIEADLEKTNLTGIDKELEEIEAELSTP